MNRFNITGWRWTRFTCLVAVCATSFVSLTASDIPIPEGKDMGYGWCSKHGNYKGASCPGCAAGSNSSQSGNYNYDPNRPNIFNFFSKMKEKRQEAREKQANDANTAGVQSYNNGDYANALAAFEKAVRLEPNDTVFQKNLTIARQQFEDAQRHQRQAAEDLRAKQQSVGAAQRMNQSIQALALSLTATPNVAPAAGGLDFDGGNTRPTNPTSNGLDFTTTIAELPNTDPMVVDARNVPSGLPKSVEETIPHTPAGNRVRKGFQAIADHDWKVARAWFQDALLREPGDPGLRRLVDLADYTMQRNTSPADKPVDAATAATMAQIDKILEEKLVEEFLSGAPSGNTNNQTGHSATPRAPDSPNLSTPEPTIVSGGSGARPDEDIIARSAATQMAARARVDALVKSGKIDQATTVARSLARNKAYQGEGYSKEELDAQFRKALTEYTNTHKKDTSDGVGGSATADEVILGGKG